MLASLTNWLSWTTTDTQNEWEAWEIWQRSQPAAHYEKSEMFQHYLAYRPQFSCLKNSVLLYENSNYYVYCFGDFAAILINQNTVSISTNEAVNYCNLLLDFYDICKGISRRITGDPVCISILRDVVNRNSILPLFKHDFDQYRYDYTILHAHTVCQYSLSTLLMRLLCNFLSKFSVELQFEEIKLKLCQSAYNNLNYGAIKNNITLPEKVPSKYLSRSSSKPLSVPERILIEEERGSSWPRNLSCSRCSKCTRVSENLWGDHHTCLDCHMKRICSKCGTTATVIGTDKLPKCEAHK